MISFVALAALGAGVLFLIVLAVLVVLLFGTRK
jgi:hypothetical protein